MVSSAPIVPTHHVMMRNFVPRKRLLPDMKQLTWKTWKSSLVVLIVLPARLWTRHNIYLYVAKLLFVMCSVHVVKMRVCCKCFNKPD